MRLSNGMRTVLKTSGILVGGTAIIIWIWWGINSAPRSRFVRRRAPAQVILPVTEPPPDEERVPERNENASEISTENVLE